MGTPRYTKEALVSAALLAAFSLLFGYVSGASALVGPERRGAQASAPRRLPGSGSDAAARGATPIGAGYEWARFEHSAYVPVAEKAWGASPDSLPFFGMEIVSAVEASRVVTVTTTGAYYVVGADSVQMWRRIDPRTNTVQPRLVASLEVEQGLEAPRLLGATKRQAVVGVEPLRLTFHSDSVFVVRCETGRVRYEHRSLIADAAWVRGSGTDRYWTDGNGGSLHASYSGGPQAISEEPAETTVELSDGDEMLHMVFPPRPFDFERLYGAQSRPLPMFIYGQAAIEANEPLLSEYADLGIGVLVLWCHIYDWEDNRTCSEPIVLESGERGYRVDSEFADRLHEFVTQAHSAGFKVIPYLSYPSGPRWDYPDGHARAGEHQPIDVTLSWMRRFQREHDFDGWYFDNADAGDLRADYGFIRQVRADVGDSGIIYHHDSVDVWGGWSGRRAVMVDTYVDYTLTGETGRETGERAEVSDPNHPYFRYYTAGYGTSQAIAAHKRLSSGRTAMTEWEKDRVIALNLNGAERVAAATAGGIRDNSWLQAFLPCFEKRRDEFASGPFRADVDWPVDPLTGWFRPPQDARAVRRGATQAVVSWRTDEPADSEVAYTSNGVWWAPNGPDGVVSASDMVTDHELGIEGLDPATEYSVRIRSRNRKGGTEEVVWGVVLPLGD